MSVASANQWRSTYAQEQLHQQTQAVANGEPAAISRTRRARIEKDLREARLRAAIKHYIEDSWPTFDHRAVHPAFDVYRGFNPPPLPVSYQQFVAHVLDLFPGVTVKEEPDWYGVRRLVFHGLCLPRLTPGRS
jgi:hypothetical protein